MIVGHLARMIKLNPLCGIIALTLCLAGCSASGARFQDTPFATQPIADDKSRIIFYRESDADFRSALYPKQSEEKRLLDAMLLEMPK